MSEPRNLSLFSVLNPALSIPPSSPFFLSIPGCRQFASVLRRTPTTIKDVMARQVAMAARTHWSKGRSKSGRSPIKRATWSPFSFTPRGSHGKYMSFLVFLGFFFLQLRMVESLPNTDNRIVPPSVRTFAKVLRTPSNGNISANSGLQAELPRKHSTIEGSPALLIVQASKCQAAP